MSHEDLYSVETPIELGYASEDLSNANELNTKGIPRTRTFVRENGIIIEVCHARCGSIATTSGTLKRAPKLTKASITHHMAANNSSPLLVPIGSNFWNIRGDFKIVKLLNVGTHMSVARLSTGKFLIIDGAPTLNNPTLVKELNELTSNGENIEAIIHTHPFHTGSIVTLSNLYPKAPVYGCPRHLKMFPDLKWTGDLSEPTNLARWQPEVDLRIPT
ncbi:hypothetical protein PROFUN_11468, partial [Planoprotostelium fungivorum]